MSPEPGGTWMRRLLLFGVALTGLMAHPASALAGADDTGADATALGEVLVTDVLQFRSRY